RPDVTIAAIHGKAPRIHDSAFIAPGCRIIGDVEIGPDASVWYNCVIRADVNRIVIGARSNIQDGSVIHCDSPKPKRPQGFPTLIGEDVLIGHLAMVHGCVLEDRAFVGLGAIVMDGCRIGSDAMLADARRRRRLRRQRALPCRGA
ncbi:MAG: gamma carbonic anhydrase family protein, partial [Novosphingobium sp.]|nr:gamma carbonic anhydrase family protein [Novosphingobium sp.]